MTKYFVWEASFAGPMAAIWFDKMKDGAGKAKPTLSIVELEDDDTRTLDKLKQDYPYPFKAKA